MKNVARGNAFVVGHTYNFMTTSVPGSSWAAKVVDHWELQQHYIMVVVVERKTQQGFA